MSVSIKPVLDHVIVLLPSEKLHTLPSWLTDDFTVLGGGQHADGVTENKLIIFGDGVYIELIAFVPGKEHERISHWWGRHPDGRIIDWAYTLPASSSQPSGSNGSKDGVSNNAEEEFRQVQEHVKTAGAGLAYDDPVLGGRTRPDGTELRWAVSFPRAENADERSTAFVRGEVPFWCFDRTPRDLRVPHHIPENISHPCGAVGIHSLSVYIKTRDLFERLHRTYEAIHGEAGVKTSIQGTKVAYQWNVLVPDDKSHRDVEVILAYSEDWVDPMWKTLLRLTLYSTYKTGTITGILSDGHKVEIDLIPKS